VVDDLRSRFEADGFVRLDAAFSPEDAAFLRDMVWRHVESTTSVRRADPTTWDGAANFGLRVVEARDVWGAVHGCAALLSALDDIFGAGRWTPPGPPQILLTFPGTEWSWPSGWHIDFGWDVPTFPVGAVKLFALLDTVDERGGGTLLLEGSHRLVEHLTRRHSGAVDPWDRNLRPLAAFPQLSHVLDGTASRAALGETIDVDGIALRPLEITGNGGDIVVAHIQLFHAPSPNSTTRPRQMIGNAVRRSGTVP
jgi:hypothetical protein